MNITQLLKEGVEYINYLTSGNEMATGLIVTGLGSAIIITLRYLPGAIWGLLLKYFTVTTTVNSSDDAYHDLMAYLDNKGMIEKSKFLTIMSGRWGDSGTHKAFGHGVQIITLFERKVLFTIDEIEMDNRIMHRLTLRTLGQSHYVINNIISNIVEKPDATKYKVSIGDRVEVYEKNRKLLPPIMDANLTAIVDKILNFKQNREEYDRLGIPFSLGVILHGIPGMGKTRLIRYLQNELGYRVYYCNTLEQFTDVPSSGNNLVILEEFDGMLKGDATKDSNALITGFLKALDGTLPVDGRITIATTNEYYNLPRPESLLRKGRFDINYEFKSLSSNQIIKFANRYYGVDIDTVDDNGNRVHYLIDTKTISGADVQAAFLEGLTLDEFLNKFLTK